MGKGSLRQHRRGLVKKRRISSGPVPKDISKAYNRNKKRNQKQKGVWVA